MAKKNLNSKKFTPDISVIVAMYNAENFIAECLKSLLNQTLKNIEVIVVDDCSTDNSAAIVKSFFTQFDERLTLTKTPRNSGYPGIPRNTALISARGKYITFVDSDDFLDEDALEKLFNYAEKFDADVVHVEKCFILKDGETLIESTQENFVEIPTLETDDIGKRVIDFTEKKYLWWACNKLFRREFLIKNNIRFAAMTTYEDLIFTFQCVISAKNYLRIPDNFYHYRIRSNSLSRRSTDGIEVAKNLIEAVKVLDKFMTVRKFFIDNPQYRYAVLDFFVPNQLEKVAQNLMVFNDFSAAEVYAFFAKEIFSLKPNENVALTSYLFVTAGLYKLFLSHKS
ncbi:MAG: glycosyltransferase [Selenomonadaceae bacterium]|nr:glycosyltransferase [Selenomonadaceae bacterium]